MGMRKRRRMRPGSLLLASAAALSLGARVGSTAPSDGGIIGGAADGAGRDQARGDGVVTLPILSHRHVVERRRRELGLAPSGDDYGHGDRGAPPHDRIPRYGTRGVGGRDLAIQQIGALYQGYGTHYIDLWVGYPAQRQTAVVDTGSSVTAFPCSGCGTSCGRHADPPFDERSSRSFRPVTCDPDSEASTSESVCVFGRCGPDGGCTIEHTFGTGDDASSWRAYEAQDVAYAAGPHDRPVEHEGSPSPDVVGDGPGHAAEFSFPLSFGCQTEVTGYFERQLASGVVGLDRRAQSFWGQMRSSQVIKRAAFGLCFVRQTVASPGGSTAGAVTLGGTDRRLHETEMVYAASVGAGGTASFKVRMRRMYLRDGPARSVHYDAKSKYHRLDADEVALNGAEMYNIDSGTTDTYLISSLSDEFRRVWKEITGLDYSNDPISTDAAWDGSLSRFPTLVMQFLPHPEGVVGDQDHYDDPRTVPGLAGLVDLNHPNDVMVAIPPRNYMQRSTSPDGRGAVYTPRIYLDRDDGLGNVLGANFMTGHDVLFDMDRSRIGFAESGCNYAGLVAGGAAGNKGGGGGGGGGPSSGLKGGAPAEDAADRGMCSSMKCKGLFGLIVGGLFMCFFAFARRYVTRRDGPPGMMPGSTPAKGPGGGESVGTFSGSLSRSDLGEFEMRSTSGRSTRDVGGSSRDREYRGGERGGYRDRVPPPPRYSDRRHGAGGSRASSSSSSSRRDPDGRSHRGRDHPHGESGSRSGSVRSGGSGGSGGSGDRSSRSVSDRSARSSRSRASHSDSVRTSDSRRSHGSHRSHRTADGSHRSGSSSRRRRSRSDSRERRNYAQDHSGGERGSSRTAGSSYRDDYDDLPMPPSIT